MQKDFTNLSNDPDTRILISLEAQLGDFDVCYQGWEFEGVRAESIIFHASDVKDFSDDDLIAEVKESPMVKPEKGFTVSRNNADFTFVNFNFETKD